MVRPVNPRLIQGLFDGMQNRSLRVAIVIAEHLDPDLHHPGREVRVTLTWLVLREEAGSVESLPCAGSVDAHDPHDHMHRLGHGGLDTRTGSLINQPPETPTHEPPCATTEAIHPSRARSP